MATVSDRVKALVADKLDIDENDLAMNLRFVEDLNADSLDLVELIMAVEEEFSTDGMDIEISDEDAGSIMSVQDIVTWLKEHGIEN